MYLLANSDKSWKLSERMHFSESGKSSIKLCVGIASIVLEGRFTGHEDDFLLENDSDQSGADLGQSFVCERNFQNDTAFARPHQRVNVKTLETFGCDVIEASSSKQCATFDSFTSGLNNVKSSFLLTPTSTPKKHPFSYIDVGWDEYENGTGARSVFLKSPSTLLGFSGDLYSSSTQNKMTVNRIRKSFSFSTVHAASQKSAKSNQGIKPGPHCENFLRKMGILKDGSVDEEHVCCPSNNVCHQWQLNLQQFLQILSRNETPCIEVYMGPDSNALLLEIWTFKINRCNSTTASTTMNIQSLCSAIRSQLYFSQISSWVDLLRQFDTDSGLDANLNARLKRNHRTKSVYLDVFYRIKSHDGIDLFTDKPIAHNFPETRISDVITLNVSLKSLPRLEKIPTLNESNSHSKVTCDYVHLNASSCLPNSSFTRSRRNSSSESPMSSSLTTAEILSTSKKTQAKETQFADHQFFEQAINDVTLPPLYTLFPVDSRIDVTDGAHPLAYDASIDDDSEVFKDSDVSTLSNLSQLDNASLMNDEHQKSETSAIICSACNRSSPDDNRLRNCDTYESCDKPIMEKLDFSSDMEQQFSTKADCRQCKRRKIRHTSHLAKGKSNRRTMSECLVGNYHQFDEQGEPKDLTQPGSNLEFPICDKNVACKIEENFPSFNELNSYRRAFSDDLINQLTDLPLNPFNGNENFNCNMLMKQREENNNCWAPEESLQTKSSLPVNDANRSKALFKRFFRKKSDQETKRLHLLGSFEENLLKNRFQPQTIVDGYKALLGASGNFCPSQLTIPAQTKFYEFQGSCNNITTPYVCEFRLSKNYAIPKSGQLNVTLMNPQGIVVRMFFIGYDLRDMPSMSQTFIRQRILASDDRTSQYDSSNLSSSEQMKYLRYSIHLRFQTSKSGRLSLHSDVKIIVMRKTEQDTAQAHAMNSIESFNDFRIITVMPEKPKYSPRNVMDN